MYTSIWTFLYNLWLHRNQRRVWIYHYHTVLTVAVGYPFLVYVWQSSRFKQTIIQIYSCMYAISNVVSPFVINLFLASVDVDASEYDCITKNARLNKTLINFNEANSFNFIKQNTTSWLREDDITYVTTSNSNFIYSTGAYAVPFTNVNQTKADIELARWSFLIGSSFSLLSGLLITSGVLLSSSVKLNNRNDDDVAKKRSSKVLLKTRLLNTLLLSFSVLLILFWAFTSGTLIQYLQAIVIIGFRWPVGNSSNLNGLLGAGQLVGSVTTILMSKINSQYTLISIATGLIFWTAGIISMILTDVSEVMSGGMMIGTFMAGSVFIVNRPMLMYPKGKNIHMCI